VLRLAPPTVLLSKTTTVTPSVPSSARFTAAPSRTAPAGSIRSQDSAITVDEAVVAAKGGVVVKGPKTRASIRRLALDPGTLEALRRLEGALIFGLSNPFSCSLRVL